MLSPFPWPGGKRALVPRLLKMIPAHRTYVEVFAGSAKLLFAKDPSSLEILNDFNGDVTNFFRVAKHRPAELAEAMERECIHAGRFREMAAAPIPEDELMRAQRFAYLAWYSFGGKGTQFARPTLAGHTRRPLDQVRGLLSDLAHRLARVAIEQRDYLEILDRYDARDTFFYLDPPYVAYCPNGRYAPFTAQRREEMFARLAQLKAKWLLSFEDHAEARAAAKTYGFTLRSVGVAYTLSSGGNRKTGREVLIGNFQFV